MASATRPDEGSEYAVQHASMSNPETSNTSVTRLMGEVVADAQLLVRKELQLARQEVTEEAQKVGSGVAVAGAGIGLVLLGAILLIGMLIALLVQAANLAIWLAFLIVAVPLLIGGAIFLVYGLNKIKTTDPLPRKAIESVRKDIAWLKAQTTSDKI